MTLTKTPPKRPATSTRKRTGQHHKHSQHYVKAYWPYLPIVAVIVLGVLTNSWMSHMNRSVLGYATDMSTQELLDGTNSQRLANGLGSLALNGKLNLAAQNKANDMAARDYWSHDTPDGQTPWTFITAAGYSYQTAGENLAYGFATASDTITGWMNSPGHRANILNTTYQEVGFGIVNIPNYQGSGPQTLVVAMYAEPAQVAAAAPAAIRPITRTPVAAPVTQPAPVAAEPVPVPAAPTPVTTTQHSDTLVATNKTVDGSDQKRVARIQLFTAANATWSILALTLLGACAVFVLLFRHILAWHRVIVRGERFVLRHPIVDFAAVSLMMIALLLSQTSGLIR